MKKEHVAALKESTLEIPLSNVDEVHNIVGSFTADVCQMFTVSTEDRVYPYDQYW